MTTTEISVRGLRKDLRVLEREVALSMASETGCCGVTLAQCHLLLETDLRGRTSVTELAGSLELDKSTMSREVGGLCEAGLLSRETDQENRRQQIISLTRKGQARADRINALCDASYGSLLDFIPAEKRQMVAESVSLLARAMRQKRKSTGSSGCCVEKGDLE
jgi:DNA-binding MarR family transcriptional regulator